MSTTTKGKTMHTQIAGTGGTARALAAGVAALALLAVSGVANARDSVSCEGKHAWRREIVRNAVHGWLASTPRADDLLELVQAEQGISACRASAQRPARLHTTRLPQGLRVDQLGAVLLANELEWAGLVPPPEEALAGIWFRVRPVAPDPVLDAPPTDSERALH